MIYAAVYSHKHGNDLFLCATDEDRTKTIADICREYWDEDWLEGPAPEDDQEVIDRYFDGNDVEYVDYSEHEGLIGA